MWDKASVETKGKVGQNSDIKPMVIGGMAEIQHEGFFSAGVIDNNLKWAVSACKHPAGCSGVWCAICGVRSTHYCRVSREHCVRIHLQR